MDDLSDQNPAERREDLSPGAVVTAAGVVEQYQARVAARRTQLEAVDVFVETYLGVVRDIAAELAKEAPSQIPVDTAYSCTADRGRCIQQLRFDGIRFSFVHLREVAYLSQAPVPEEIAGQVLLYVQELPPDARAPLADGHLISSLLVYPLRREWRFVWGGSAGRLYPFSAVDALRDKVLRDLRGVLTGSSSARRWPEFESITRVPAQVLEMEKAREDVPIGFLRPSLKMTRGLAVPAGAETDRARTPGEGASGGPSGTPSGPGAALTGRA